MNETRGVGFADWLEGEPSESEDRRYRHRRLDERAAIRPQIMDALQSFVDRAHEDARSHLSKLVGISLDPLEAESAMEALSGYPRRLHPSTLKAYLGEILAGLFCDHFRPFDEDGWKVPAFLFRFHDVAFHELERVRQTGGAARPIPGRFGTDCLAFLRGPDGRIVRTIFCEAKCTSRHNSEMIREAHRQLSDELLTPVDLPQVIEVLVDRATPEARDWVKALQRLRLAPVHDSCERCDLVSYACGQSPVVRPSWIPCDVPHEAYAADRRLEAVEVHLDDVEDLITLVYGGDEGGAGE